MFKPFTAILIFLGTACTVAAQSVGNDATALVKKTDSIIQQYMQEASIVGLSLGIVKDGQLYLTRGYGLQELGTRKTTDSLTNYMTCSITKLFTATAVMQLVEQGKIDIRQKLIFYLPDFTMKDERYKDITIEHLLSHSSGLPWDKVLKDVPDDSSALRKLVYSFSNSKLAFTPGTKFNPVETYSNAAYDILGYLVQTLSGKPYTTYIQEHILQPAGMQRSGFDHTAIAGDRKSTPHIMQKKTVKTGGIVTEGKAHDPSANLNSNAADLCHWMETILKTAKNSSTSGLLQYQSQQQMWTPRHTAPQNKAVSIGLGWWITQSASRGTYYWHVGNNPGWSATLMIFPEQNFGITLLSNGMYAEDIVWNKISFAVIDLFKDGWK